MRTYEASDEHDWAHLKAVGEWIVCEQVGVIAKTREGIHVPDSARMAVWIVYSAGEDVKRVVVGDRVVFQGHQSHDIDGRRFAILNQEQIMAVLPMPKEADEPDEAIPEVLPHTPRTNGKSRIIVPS